MAETTPDLVAMLGVAASFAAASRELDKDDPDSSTAPSFTSPSLSTFASQDMEKLADLVETPRHQRIPPLEANHEHAIEDLDGEENKEYWPQGELLSRLERSKCKYKFVAKLPQKAKMEFNPKKVYFCKVVRPLNGGQCRYALCGKCSSTNTIMGFTNGHVIFLPDYGIFCHNYAKISSNYVTLDTAMSL